MRSEHGVILIDPSMPAAALTQELFDQSGIRAEDVKYIYFTHNHGDHWMGTEAFPNAKLCMPEEDLRALKADRAQYEDAQGDAIDRMVGVTDELLPGFKLVPLPGHTMGLCGLLFDAPEGRVLAAGDAVMGKEYFHAKRGYFYSLDQELSARSIEKAAALADVIIPGHGNYFSVKAYMFE